MPLYDFVCDCGKTKREVLCGYEDSSDATATWCPDCRTPLKRRPPRTNFNIARGSLGSGRKRDEGPGYYASLGQDN